MAGYLAGSKTAIEEKGKGRRENVDHCKVCNNGRV